MELVVHDTPREVAEAAADAIADLMSVATGRFTLGLAGGRTPEATYLELRDRATGWQDVHAWLSDERWVPHDDERCNGLLAATALLDHVDVTFHRPHWSEFISPADSAAHYEATIRSIHHDRRPDLVLLGMGRDGHTASLFPGTKALEEDSRWIVANRVPEIGETRITATFPLLWSARLLMVLVTGEPKAAAVRDSFAGKTPAGRLSDGDAEVVWHIDRAAASLLF